MTTVLKSGGKTATMRVKQVFLSASDGEVRMTFQQGRLRGMNEREQEAVAQTMIPLPFLSDEVPALYLADGRPYIPVFAVCHALGIRADLHIRRWRRKWRQTISC